MSPWTGRRSPRRSPPNRIASRRFEELPEDVIISICSHCRIETLFALRLTSSRIRCLITEYITTIAPAVARSTFPLNDHLLTPPKPPSSYSIAWLKDLIPRQLAAILVDRHRFSHGGGQGRYGIPAEDPFGDELRGRVANGWRVLKTLSNISKDVYNSPESTLSLKSSNFTSRLVNSSRYTFLVSSKREELVYERRCKYIRNLPQDMIHDYKLMFMLLSFVFRTPIENYGDQFKPWIFDWGYGLDGQRLLRRGSSWLTWFILHEGPDIFWDQWWFLPPNSTSTKNYIRDRSIDAWFSGTNINPDAYIKQSLLEEWSDVNEKGHSMQRGYASKIQRAFDERISIAVTGFHTVSPIGYFVDYADHRQLLSMTSEAPVRETLSHVPFHVDFRCPEELFQRFQMSKQERAMAMKNPPRGDA